jgi:putative transposase
MVRYRRNFVPGGTYFFTVTLADRTSSALVDHVSTLRMAFRIARHERPFTIDAIVVLPDHLHALWTLPPGDPDFSGRWRRIKAYFTHRLVAAGVPSSAIGMANTHSGNGALRAHDSERDRFRATRRLRALQPVKHKLVRRAPEWPYSSFHLYVRRGLLPADWAGEVDEHVMDFGERTGRPRISLRFIRATWFSV